jgi:hypothetical protein
MTFAAVRFAVAKLAHSRFAPQLSIRAKSNDPSIAKTTDNFQAGGDAEQICLCLAPFFFKIQ